MLSDRVNKHLRMQEATIDYLLLENFSGTDLNQICKASTWDILEASMTGSRHRDAKKYLKNLRKSKHKLDS